MRPLNYNAIPVQTAADIYSDPIRASSIFKASAIAVAVGGSTSGTLKFQASNDGAVILKGQENTPINWVDIASQTVAVNAAGVFIIPQFDVCYEWIRVFYDNAGSGTIQVSVKTLGA